MSADTSRLSAVIARSARNVSACGRRSTLARTASTEGTSMCRPGPSVRWYLPDTSRLSAVIARSARNVSACGRRSTLARTASTEGTSMCRPGPSVRWYLPSRSTRSTCSLGTIRRQRSRMNTINATTTAAVNASALNDEGSMSTMVLPVRVPVEPALAVLETRAQVERHRPIAGVDGHVLQSPVTRLCQNGVEQRRADPAVAQLGYHVHRLHVAGAPVDPRRARYPGSQHQPRHPGHSTVHLGQERQMGRQVVDDPGGEVLQECRVIRAGLVALLARPPPPQPRQGRGIGGRRSPNGHLHPRIVFCPRQTRQVGAVVWPHDPPAGRTPCVSPPPKPAPSRSTRRRPPTRCEPSSNRRVSPNTAEAAPP